MKKENIIIIFYILYFSWLFTVAFLTPSEKTLNYFTGIITAIYFIFLKEKGDIYWFLFSAIVPFIFTFISFSNWQFSYNSDVIKYFPIWLPLAWGTTIVALRKFYIVITK